MSQETELKLVGYRDIAYVWRNTGEAYNGTVTHDGGNIMPCSV